MIDLSIVIPIYNGELLLKRCLDSVLAQKTKYKWEIWIVDDGSTDGSAKIEDEYIKSQDKCNCINVLKQKNEGPSKARNWGIKESQGRYIALLDADDYWEESYIEKTVSFLDEHPECVATSVVCKNIAVSGTTYTPEWYNNINLNDYRLKACTQGSSSYISEDKNKAPHRGILKKNEKTDNKWSYTPFIIDGFFAYWAKECHVGTCSTTMKADIAKNILMREDLRISEDYEFWMMLALHGKWGVIPEPLYVSDGTRAITNQKAWINKMQRRWNNAPSMAEWEKRILQQSPELKKNEDFRWAEGRVSRNLTYCQLLSGRDTLARNEALEYGHYFLKDPIGKLMNVCKWTSISWWMLCKYLRYREEHRF